MDLKRRTVGLTLPFIFGDAAAIFCGTKFYHWTDGPVTAGCVVLAALAFLSFRIVIDIRKGDISARDTLLTAACVFLCGFFCGLAASLPTAGPVPNPLEEFLSDARNALTGSVSAAGFRDGRCEAIVRALLTGDRSLLDPGTKAAFRGSGASHILALSGFHLGIIYLLLSKSLAPIGRSPAAIKVKSAVICLATGFYSVLSGGSPSIVRAFLFILLNEACSMSLRKPQGAGLLSASLMLQLTFSPLTITTISFQLSYLAMSGIVFIFPAMKEWWGGRKGILKKIWETCALAISCQVFTAPAVWAYFGTFPTYFLLTNLIATPLVTLIMFLSLAATALSAAGACPEILVSADEKLIKALLFCLETISSL
ncbi:MAG: ComEC/Rec2 family competence protein [Candidatus Cryptobacteroides sp.]